jgi:hypothetical protein
MILLYIPLILFNFEIKHDKKCISDFQIPYKMAKNNNKYDILEQIIKYYKLIKQIKIKIKYVPIGD